MWVGPKPNCPGDTRADIGQDEEWSQTVNQLIPTTKQYSLYTTFLPLLILAYYQIIMARYTWKQMLRTSWKSGYSYLLLVMLNIRVLVRLSASGGVLFVTVHISILSLSFFLQVLSGTLVFIVRKRQTRCLINGELSNIFHPNPRIICLWCLFVHISLWRLLLARASVMITKIITTRVSLTCKAYISSRSR